MTIARLHLSMASGTEEYVFCQKQRNMTLKQKKIKRSYFFVLKAQKKEGRIHAHWLPRKRPVALSKDKKKVDSFENSSVGFRGGR